MTHNYDCTLSSDTVFLRPGGHPQMEPELGAAGLPKLGTSCMEMKWLSYSVYIFECYSPDKSPINAIGLVV